MMIYDRHILVRFMFIYLQFYPDAICFRVPFIMFDLQCVHDCA